MKKIVRKITLNGDDYFWRILHDHYEGDAIRIFKNKKAIIQIWYAGYIRITPGLVRAIIETPPPQSLYAEENFDYIMDLKQKIENQKQQAT